MIAIVNITQPCEPLGVHTYSLRINRQEVCQFDHRREAGLAACLMAAAKAVEKQKWMDVAKFMELINPEAQPKPTSPRLGQKKGEL